jgi:hypothetical protein
VRQVRKDFKVLLVLLELPALLVRKVLMVQLV